MKIKDLQNLLPFTTALVVLRVSGALLLETLNAGVSGLPALEGRFPQVSGLRFVYNPPTIDPDTKKRVQPAKVVPDSVFVNGKQLDLEASYTLCLPSFIGRGKVCSRGVCIYCQPH